MKQQASTGSPPTDSTTWLPIIEREISRDGWRPRFGDASLEREYGAGQRNSARLHNRVTVALLVAIFDAFFIAEISASPEVLTLSAVLRFCLLTPAMLAYLLLDWRGRLARWNTVVVVCLLIAPTLVALLENLRATSPSALPNLQAVPLIQLVVLTSRVSVRQAIVINAASCLLFVWSVLGAHFVPHSAVPSLILTDVAIAVSSLVFAWRIDLRERTVFLFTRQAAIGREVLAGQNRILSRMTQLDALTGLGNRRCFNQAIADLWASGVEQPMPVSLIMFDIDCFKQFNDMLGHQAGDECLGAMGRTVSRCLRDDRDTLVRYGGEEFAIILPHTQLEEARAVAERVRSAVVDRALPHPGGGPLHLVTVSLGVATVTAPVQSAAFLVEAADQCLYAAKRLGRNRIEAGIAPPEAPADQLSPVRVSGPV